MKSLRPIHLLAAAAVAAVLRGQDPSLPPPPPATDTLLLPLGALTTGTEGDYKETRLLGGFRLLLPRLQVEVHGQRAVLLLDRDEAEARLQPEGRLPRRLGTGIEPRRRLTPDVVRGRLESSLRAAGMADPGAMQPGAPVDLALQTWRYLYCEGDVVILRQGVVSARARRLWISPLDDRLLLEGAELRYVTVDKKGTTRVLTVRGDQLEKQGPRWTGRDLVISSCDAGEPHTAVLAGEVEIRERDGEFEVLTRGTWLRFAGKDLVPLPDSHFFTGEQSEFPVKGASAAYSQKEGSKLQVDLGLHWNDTGGKLHEWVTGRPAGEFRGDWLLGIGWIEKRGFPLDAGITYGAKDVYEGRSEVFWLDDSGTDIREVLTNVDGSPIDQQQRTVVRTQNRVHFGPATHLDVSAFRASDAAVYSEFFQGDYHTKEQPETSAYFTTGAENRLFTANGRFNLDDFSYRDDRALAQRFVEEEPVATFHWVAQPIGTTPFDTPIVLDTATEIGQRRSNYDDLAGLRVTDRTFRVDQLVELSTPFLLGPVSVRPFAQARTTYFDRTVDLGSENRIAFAAGVQVGTRLQRTYGFTGSGGDEQSIRHVIAPQVTLENRFRVDDRAADFHQFDATDALTEQDRVRFGVRNLFERMEGGKGGAIPQDFLFVDLAQNLFPNAGRDNAGEHLGLFEYELLLRPRARWIPLQTFSYGIEGEHDWRDGLRTFNTELQAGRILGFTWTAEYRRDAIYKGTVGLGANTNLYDRWDVFGAGQYDVDRSYFQAYTIGLMRRDHDWSIGTAVSYDPFTRELSFRLQFIPRLGGLVQPRDRSWFDGQRLYSTGGVTDY